MYYALVTNMQRAKANSGIHIVLWYAEKYSAIIYFSDSGNELYFLFSVCKKHCPLVCKKHFATT
jgi:hypothetical protein